MKEIKGKKHLCFECGGEKPPPPSPGTRARERANKQRLNKIKQNELKKERAAKGQEEKDKFYRQMPAQIQLLMRACCGYGRTKKKVKDSISLKYLRKHISSLHPVDPLSQEKFAFGENITVNKYGYKLADACYCLAILNFSKKCQRKCYAWCFKK